MGPFATFHRHPLAARSAVAMSAGWTGRSGHGRHVGCHAALLRGPAAGAPTSPRRWAWAIWAWEDSEGLAGEDWGKMWETPAEFGWRRRFFCLKLVVSTAVFFVLVESLAICHDEQTSSSFIIHANSIHLWEFSYAMILMMDDEQNLAPWLAEVSCKMLEAFLLLVEHLAMWTWVKSDHR